MQHHTMRHAEYCTRFIYLTLEHEAARFWFTLHLLLHITNHATNNDNSKNALPCKLHPNEVTTETYIAQS